MHAAEDRPSRRVVSEEQPRLAPFTREKMLAENRRSCRQWM